MFQARYTAALMLPLAGAAPLAAHGQDVDALGPDSSAAPQAQAPGQHVKLQWGDFDADGLVDALAISPERGLKLMRNAGDGSFADATVEARLDGVVGASFGLWQDFDSDGQLDLFVGTEAGPCHLFRNVEGAFIDVTTEMGIDAVGTDRTAHWVDYDKDGRVDLHLAYGMFNVFYHALPAGGFERVSLPSLLLDPTKSAPLMLTQMASADADSTASGAPSEASHADHDFSDGRRLSLSPGGSGAGTSLDAGGQSAGGPGTSMPTGTATISGVCAQSLWDASGGGGCLQGSSEATLGMLYPLSEKFYIDETTGNVGIGTASPSRHLHIKSTGFWPVLIESTVNAGIQLNNLSAASSWAIFHEGDDSLSFRDSFDGITRMKIRGDDGSVEMSERLRVNTIAPAAGLRVEGMVRAGSETGTDQGPDTAYNYQGVITRRIASTSTSAGSVVARSQWMRLTRDGSNGVFSLEWDAGALNDQVAYGTGLTSAGATVPIVINLGGQASAGSQALYTDTDIVRLDLVFGTTFNIREMTEVTLMRSAGDFWWVGSVTSTWDQ